MVVLVTLNSGQGVNLGPNFTLSANTGTITPATATLTQLLAGIYVTVDNAAVSVTITSTGSCTNSLVLNINSITTTTTTTTAAPTTTTTTTTAAPTTTTTTTTAAPTTTTTSTTSTTSTTTAGPTTTSTTSTTSTTTAAPTTTTTTKPPFTACMSDFSDASACNCDGLSYGTWTFYGSGIDICSSTTITSSGILAEIENNGYFWIASGGNVRYYQKNGTTSSATAQAACFVCPTTTTSTTTTLPPVDFSTSAGCANGVSSDGVGAMVSFNGGSGVYQASDFTHPTQVSALNGSFSDTNVSISRTFSGLSAGTYWVALRDKNNTDNKIAHFFTVTTCPTTTTTTQAPVTATVSGACTGNTQTITVNSFSGGDGSTYYVSNTTYGDAGSAGAATANVLVAGGTYSYGSQPSGTRYVKIASTIRTSVESGGQSCTTTTTTTTQPPVWYYLYNCSTGAIQTSATYPNGTFAVDQRVVYGGSLFFYVTQVVFSNPGGIQWSISSAGAGLTFCPATTTTTTIAPIVTRYYVAQRCDNPFLEQYFQTTGTYPAGASVKYQGYCWEIQAEQGASGVNPESSYIDCASCTATLPTTTTTTLAPTTTTTTAAPTYNVTNFIPGLTSQQPSEGVYDYYPNATIFINQAVGFNINFVVESSFSPYLGTQYIPVTILAGATNGFGDIGPLSGTETSPDLTYSCIYSCDQPSITLGGYAC